jgi:hypothetical protein
LKTKGSKIKAIAPDVVDTHDIMKCMLKGNTEAHLQLGKDIALNPNRTSNEMTNEIMRQYQNNQPSSNGNSFTIAFL